MADLHVSDRLDDYLEGEFGAAERARVEAHLTECTACADELRELRATVALLRSLPDPEHAPTLRLDVMRRIEAGEARPPLLQRLLRFTADPRLAAPVAAAIAVCLLLVQSGGWNLLGPSTTPPGPADATLVPADETGASAPEARRPPPVRWAPAPVGSPPVRRVPAAYAGYNVAIPTRRPMVLAGLPLTAVDRTAPVAPMRDLDAEIAEAMWNPDAFVARVRNTRVDARRPLMAPLVEHAAQHGDASAVARHLGLAAQPAAFMPAAFSPSGR